MVRNECCGGNQFCGQLEEASRQYLCRNSTCFHLSPKKELIFNKSSSQIAVVKSGLLVSIAVTEEGNLKSIELFKPGAFLRMDNLAHDDDKANVYLQAFTPASLCLFSETFFKNYFEQSAEFSYIVLSATTSRLKENLNHLYHIKTDSSEEKIRYLLKSLQKANIDCSYLTHEDIALLTDLNRVTVTRALKNINRNSEIYISKDKKHL